MCCSSWDARSQTWLNDWTTILQTENLWMSSKDLAKVQLEISLVTETNSRWLLSSSPFWYLKSILSYTIIKGSKEPKKHWMLVKYSNIFFSDGSSSCQKRFSQIFKWFQKECFLKGNSKTVWVLHRLFHTRSLHNSKSNWHYFALKENSLDFLTSQPSIFIF